MLNLLSFFIGITTILLIARYNKSNKLFWVLLLSMMTGFIGGTVVSNLKKVNKVNKEVLSTDTNSIVIYGDSCYTFDKTNNNLNKIDNDTVSEQKDDTIVNDDLVSKPKKPRNKMYFFDTS